MNDQKTKQTTKRKFCVGPIKLIIVDKVIQILRSGP